MNRPKLLLLTSLLYQAATATPQYVPDILGEPFEQRTIQMPNDYEGAVETTLIRLTSPTRHPQAVLYLHGYNDYFFQREMALKFDSAGYQFYALDLRKYGRSLLSHQQQFNVRNLHEYFADLDSAFVQIAREGYSKPILMGHSTGGLTATLYVEARKEQLPIAALLLNSPFFDQNQSWFMEKIVIPIVTLFAPLFPNLKINQAPSTAYAESLLKSHHGEWEYDTKLKQSQSPPITLSWLNAIYQGQRKLQRGVTLTCPTLLLHSDSTTHSTTFDPTLLRADAVLDINDILRYGRKLGPNTQIEPIPNGLHDLSLSAPSVRHSFFERLFLFLRNLTS